MGSRLWSRVGPSPGENTVKRSQDEALVSLLVDESPRVRTMVRTAVQQRGLAIAPVLRDVLSTAPDRDVRAAAREMLEELERRVVLGEIETALEAEPFDLLRAQIALARIEHPDLDEDAIRGPLAAMVDEVREALPAVRDPQADARVLARVLGQRHDLRGDVVDYYDPRNSLLDQVLERRVGIPISLSAIYILVGREAGLEMHGVGMPAHFLTQISQGSERALLDPFDRGRIIPREQCLRFLTGIASSDRARMLEPVSDLTLLRRAVNNLVLVTERSGDTERHRIWRAILERLSASAPA